MHDELRISRVVGDGAAEDRDRSAFPAFRPAAVKDRLCAGKRTEAGLDAAENNEGYAVAAAERVRLNRSVANGDGCDRHWAARYHRSMASISRDDVLHVARLARLHLSDEEVDRMQTQLSNILAAIETLRDVDTSHVGPTASVIRLENVMRDDEPRPPMSREAALANAPLRDDPFLRVPTVLEEGR